MNYHAGDPLNDIREVVLATTKQGTRVTIVNEVLLDLRTGEMRSNVISVQAAFLQFLNVDTGTTRIIRSKVPVLSLSSLPSRSTGLALGRSSSRSKR